MAHDAETMVNDGLIMVNDDAETMVNDGYLAVLRWMQCVNHHGSAPRSCDQSCAGQAPRVASRWWLGPGPGSRDFGVSRRIPLTGSGGSGPQGHGQPKW